MAFDGITVAAVVNQLNKELAEGRISKIAEPEKDELLLTIKNSSGNHRLVLSANPSLPLVYLTEENKVSPVTAPAFTMLLRKHIQNGRIIDIYQPGMERIIVLLIEHLNEMGDICRKKLIIELMGKYSNIIFTDDTDVILDSIKRVNAMTSSVREVLPGLKYFIPVQEGKKNPLEETEEGFAETIKNRNEESYKALYMSYVGLSPLIAHEICYRAEKAGGRFDKTATDLSDAEIGSLWKAFEGIMTDVKAGSFAPNVVYENGLPVEYEMLDLTSYTEKVNYDSPSELLIAYYREKETATRSKQKSADLRKIVSTILERDIKKYDLQLKQLKDTEKMDKYKVYGELLHTYGYEAKPGDKSITVVNYYDNKEITIPLDADLTPMENAKKYFDKYGKLKRTREALETLTVEVKEEIDHLESVLQSLEIVSAEEDLNEIKEELISTGYIRRKGGKVKQRFKSKPFHYISSDGFHMYVGKNNYQNDELTFKEANGGDWWFHAKGIPGSHVIVKTEGKELPDRTFEEAARLAAHYSKGSENGKVEIDYVKRKEVKKPGGAKPGFVVYYTNYSMMIDNDISGIKEVDD